MRVVIPCTGTLVRQKRQGVTLHPASSDDIVQIDRRFEQLVMRHGMGRRRMVGLTDGTLTVGRKISCNLHRVGGAQILKRINLILEEEKTKLKFSFIQSAW